MLTHISLFSGIGGIDLAAEWAGFKTVCFVEKDPFCQKVLNKHWPEVPIYDDVTTFDGSDWRGISLLSGGFPCQPYSQAGERRGAEDHRALWPEMLRIIASCRPAWVLGENVAGFVSLGLDSCLSDLESKGYTCQAFLVPASGVGAPHQRNRVFVVAVSDGGGCTAGSLLREEARARGTQLGNPSSDRKQTMADPARVQPGWQEQRTQRERIRQSCEPKHLSDPDCKSQGWTSKPRSECGFWLPEPNVGRVANGVPRRVDRLRALGNAVVPQQVYPILQAIADQLRGVA